MDNKVALVIEGGAMRGAFLKGVLDCFKENKIKFPYIVGVSAGAITGFEFLSGIEFDVNKLFNEFLKNMEILKNSSEPIDLVSMVNRILNKKKQVILTCFLYIFLFYGKIINIT